jgi:DNA polymerase III psi subunit
MITPSIKTNLILKEMGITRYELRSKQQSDLSKTIFSYQKGNILTLLEQSYDDLNQDEVKLLDAIVDAVNSSDNKSIKKESNLADLTTFVSSMNDIKGIIIFLSDVSILKFSVPFVQSPSLKIMNSDQESKKILWKQLKEIILK